jgi:hypothetical protein
MSTSEKRQVVVFLIATLAGFGLWAMSLLATADNPLEDWFTTPVSSWDCSGNCAVHPPLGPDGDGLFVLSDGTWTSAQTCSDGYPFCWTARFPVGSRVEWTAARTYNQGNNGDYLVVDVYFYAPWRRYFMTVEPLPTLVDIGAYGALAGLEDEVFSDGFETGDVSAWSAGVP